MSARLAGAAGVLLLAAGALMGGPAGLLAANLDVATSYRMRAIAYKNLNLQEPANNRSFISQNAGLSVFVREIGLSNLQLFRETGETSMDVGLSLRAVGVAGSSAPLQAPFIAAAAHHPNTAFTPFIENAYIKLRHAFGRPVDLTFGQQPFTLGNGLLLSDDGVGMAGATVLGSLPWAGLKSGGFILQPRNSQGNPNSLMTFGLLLELPVPPGEGTWQLNYLVEKDKLPQNIGAGIPVLGATRKFFGLGYHIAYGPLVFDGEGALERGGASAAPHPANPGGGRVAFQGHGLVLKGKWRQSLWRGGEGIARFVFARGSGDSADTSDVDEAFFPSHGRRYDGLERSGFGDFFAATPYDAFGGRSTATATGLPSRLSGIQTVGLGFTPPAWRGASVDIDYFLFQADRNSGGAARTLGTEMDIKFRWRMRETLGFMAGVARFTVGDAISPNQSRSTRYIFEASGRF